MHWCADHPALIAQLTSRLKPAGQLALHMPMNHDYSTHLCAEALARKEPYRTWLNEDFRVPPLLTIKAYTSLLFHLGFPEQKVSMKVYGHVLQSRQEVVEWVKGTFLTYYQSRFSPEQYQAFLKDYEIELMQLLPDEKPFFYPFKRILIWARSKAKI